MSYKMKSLILFYCYSYFSVIICTISLFDHTFYFDMTLLVFISCLFAVSHNHHSPHLFKIMVFESLPRSYSVIGVICAHQVDQLNGFRGDMGEEAVNPRAFFGREVEIHAP